MRGREELKYGSGDTLRWSVPAVPVVPPLEPFPGLVRLIIERSRLRGVVACRPRCPKEKQDFAGSSI